MFKFDETLTMVVRHDLENGNVPMLLGEPGIGKSSWVECLAAGMNTKCFTLPCNQLADKADMTGARLVPCGTDADGNTVYKQTFYPHAIIHEACEYARKNPNEYPILFMDELNRTTPDVTSEALSIPTTRKIGCTKLPKNLRVVTAGNDKGNVTSLDTASISRFSLYPVAPDLNTFLAVNPELNEFIKKTLVANPKGLFCKSIHVAIAAQASGKDDDDDDNNGIIDAILDDGDKMEQFTTPRTITNLSKWLNSFTRDELLQLMNIQVERDDGETITYLQAVIEGHVGHTDFAVMLNQELTVGLATAPVKANIATIDKPACYDTIMAAPDMTTLNSIVDNLAANERAAAFAYMLTVPVDHKVQINAILPKVDAADYTPYFLTLADIARADRVNQGNLEAAINLANSTGHPLAVTLNYMLAM